MITNVDGASVQTLAGKVEKLKNLGYMITIPANSNFATVMGQNGRYFKAKRSASNTITANLNRLGVLAWCVEDADGYNDFYIK
jgi:hypothetical protein